jgi:chromosome segregation ATPase
MYFIIGFCVFFVAVGASATAYHYYQENQNLKKTMAELALAQEVMAKAEQEALKAANNLQKEVNEQADILMAQAKKQQSHVNQGISQLNEQADLATVSVDNLSETASVLLNVSHVAEEQALELTSELNQAKAEMAALNEKLKLTQQALVVKEKMLSDTVMQLQSAQSTMGANQQTTPKSHGISMKSMLGRVFL